MAKLLLKMTKKKQKIQNFHSILNDKQKILKINKNREKERN